MKKIFRTVIFLSVVLFPMLSQATDVGGILYNDTVWDTDGSPYNIIEKIQTDEGVTLTIEAGVVVNGISGGIELAGDLNAIGTETSKIFLNNIGLFERSSATHVNIQFAVINGGSYYFCQNSSSFSLRDSKVQNIGGITIFTPSNSNESFMERNIFLNIGRIKLEDSSVHVRNNVFYEQNEPLWVEIENAIVEYNSFLSTDRIVIVGQFSFSAINNFWNTTDTNVIDSMIFDGKDDLNYPIIEYIPFLTEPHPDTPIPDFNQAPIADCGVEKIPVFDEVTLDGSGSYDPDGTITTYEWSFHHQDGSIIHATGSNPTITNIPSGFYDGYLTVTDDGGLVGIDSMLLAAAGPCFCTASTMHIESILAGTAPGTKGKKYGQVTVSIYDDCGSPVPGAEVLGDFTGDFNEPDTTGTTNGDGIAVIITSAQVKKPSYTFCVDAVVHTTLPYDPADNLVEDCETR